MGIYFLGTYNHHQTFFWEKVEENLEEHLLGTYICKYYIFYINLLYCYEKHISEMEAKMKKYIYVM
jgi:hypothetical protein